MSKDYFRPIFRASHWNSRRLNFLFHLISYIEHMCASLIIFQYNNKSDDTQFLHWISVCFEMYFVTIWPTWPNDHNGKYAGIMLPRSVMMKAENRILSSRRWTLSNKKSLRNLQSITALMSQDDASGQNILANLEACFSNILEYIFPWEASQVFVFWSNNQKIIK